MSISNLTLRFTGRHGLFEQMAKFSPLARTFSTTSFTDLPFSNSTKLLKDEEKLGRLEESFRGIPRIDIFMIDR